LKAMLFTPVILALALAACADQSAELTSVLSEPIRPATAETASLKSGEQVYKQVCAACHAAGVANAPKSGDTESWAELIEEGQATVTAHGWVGVRAMPPKGGRADLSLEEFARATAWMARSAGADWQDPDGALLEAMREEEKKRIEDLKARS
jgi:cytochrome c5